MNVKNIMKTRTALEKHTPDNTGKATNTRTSRLYTTALLLISLGFTTVLSQTTQAQPLPVYGHIYGLGVIKDKNQTPYWGEYDTSGQLVTDTKLGLAIDDFAPDNIRIISAIGYNAYRQQYLDHKTQHQDSPHNDYILAKLIRPDDNASDNSLTLQQLDGSPLVLQLTDGTAISLNDYPLRDDSHYLLLNPPTTVVELDSDNNPQDATIALRYLGSALNTIINTQLPLNPTVVLNGHPQENTDSTDNTGNTDNNTVNPDKTTTVMLDTRSGDIRYQSPHNIGYRTAYYTNNQNQDDTIPSQSLALRDQYTDTILNPIAGALIDLNGTQATSLDNGGFQLITAGWYCNWVQQAPLSAEINYQSFNPRRPNKQASFLLWNTIMPPCYTVSYDFINPWAPPVMTLNADNRQIEYTRRKGVYDFRVSLASITGKLNIIGATVVPDETDDGDTNYTRYTDKDYLPTLDTLDNSLSTSVQNALNDNIIYTIYNEDTGEYTHQQLPANGNTNSEAQALIATTGLLDPESDISQANLGYTLQDFDNDGQPDTALIGRIEANPDTTDGAPDLIFNINVDPNAETDTDTDNSNGDSTDPDNPDNNDEPQNPIVQGIYLSSTGNSHANGDLPDITRVPDTNTSLQHQALVNTITETDLYNTDLYLVRQSTGEIVAERNGAAIARDDTLNAQNDNDGINTNSLNGVALDDQLLNFQLMVIGPDSHRDQRPGTNPSDTTTFTQQWQSQNGLNPKYTQRTGVNHLRPGETVKLIAINRATGYIGTKTFTWNNNALNNNTNARLSEDIGTITLLPPNLKIWAERQYTVEKGATQGQTRRYLIGNEGSALQSDTTVTVYTQWLDHDNTPLPQSLGDFGYTGRIAKITEPNKVATLTGSDTTFAIKPGTHIELLRVSDLAITNDHLYIQVNGEPFSRNPSFATDANRLETLTNEQKFETNDIHEGRLKYRPDHFVPFKVNVYDEGSSRALELAYTRAVQQLREQQNNDENEDSQNTNDGNSETDQGDTEIDLQKPAPVYQWLYRPDYQYSVYDLTVKQLTAQTDPDDEDTIRSFISDNDTDPDPLAVLGSNDSVFNLIYDLAGNENDALQGYSFEGKKDEQLVFALGETELRATVGENQQLQFEDLSQLQHLSPEDYLTLRLYNNNDVANTLWEWAFELFEIYTVDDSDYNLNNEDVYYVTADNPVVNLEAELVGYNFRQDDKKTPQTIYWRIDSDQASLSNVVERKEKLATFATTLTIEPIAGTSVTVSASLLSDASSQAQFRPVVVLPGEPAAISLSSPDTLYTQNANSIDITATVTDAHGNPVIDGTIVGYSVRGSIYSQSKQATTVNGSATITLAGGYFPNDNNTLVVSVDDISAQTTLAVSPVSVEWKTPPPALADTNTSVGVTAIVSANEQPVTDAFVEAYTSHGLLSSEQLRTDENGEILFNWHTGSIPAAADLRLKIGGQFNLLLK